VNIPSNDDREPSFTLFGRLENSTAGQTQTSEAVFDGLPAVSGQALPKAGLLPDGAQQNALVQDPNAMASGPAAESDSLPDKGLAALISARLSALDGQAAGDLSGAPNTYADGNAYGSTYQAYDQPYYPYQNPPLAQPEQAEDASGNPLPPNQTFPTSILYERAKQASVAKTSAHARREGIHSTRRPWSSEEEKALMMGLDMVKGPHWSQILGIFGHNGTISDILKDRTQVQLKDKARNLKLFFLKTNSEMPYYLQCVTGELKTRAPSQAARREAEDRARMNSDEEQARLAGIMTLAGGLQNNASAGATAAASTVNVSASPGTPTPYVGAPLRSAATPAPAVPGPITPATRSGPSPIQPLSAITGPRYLAALANQARVAAQQRPASPANLAPAIKKEPAETLSLPRSAATIQPTTLGNLDIGSSLAARKTATPPAVPTPTAVQQPPVAVSVPTSLVPVTQAATVPSPATTIAATAAVAAPVNAAPDQDATSLSQEAADALQEANMVQALREVVAGP
jgi:protein TBF1